MHYRSAVRRNPDWLYTWISKSIWMEKARHKKVHTTWLHLYKILEQANEWKVAENGSGLPGAGVTCHPPRGSHFSALSVPSLVGTPSRPCQAISSSVSPPSGGLPEVSALPWAVSITALCPIVTQGLAQRMPSIVVIDEWKAKDRSFCLRDEAEARRPFSQVLSN